MINNEQTEKLINEIRDSSNVYKYISKYNTDFPNVSFINYVNLIIQKKHLKKSDVIKKTGLHRTYAYQIFSGKKKPSRDKVIRISFGLQLDLENT